MDIIDAIYSYLPAKRKQTPSGWLKFNAVCCHHNGTSADTRQRAGIIRNAEGCSYHCFNCGYKASYQPGRHLTRKMRQLLTWLGANDDAVNKLALEALRIESDAKRIEQVSIPQFPTCALPEGSRSFSEWASFLSLTDESYTVPEEFAQAVAYVTDRGLSPRDFEFYWTKTMPDRVIIPFTYEQRIVGWTARKLTDGKPKYLSEQTPGYVFNLDSQELERESVIVVEGPFDAMAVDGVALLGAEIMDKQALLINRLNRRPILVPDRDKSGLRTIEQAIALGWSVSIPDWADHIKDASDAAQHYGSLATVWSIIDAAEQSEIKIRLRLRSWLKEH